MEVFIHKKTFISLFNETKTKLYDVFICPDLQFYCKNGVCSAFSTLQTIFTNENQKKAESILRWKLPCINSGLASLPKS